MKPDIRSRYPQLPASVEVIDCTLRDGEQAPGVWFTAAEKLALGGVLAAAGVAVLDAGFPASSGAEVEIIQALRAQRLTARIGVTARAVRTDILAAERAHAEEVFLFLPTSDMRLQETLGISRAQAGEVLRAGAELVLERGMGLNLVFEDASRAEPTQLAAMILALPADIRPQRLVLCDTVGCAHPGGMQELFSEVNRRLEGAVALCAHCHNDLGLATANTLAAVTGGARSITCTVNGIGERAGNADLAECVAGLYHLFGVETGIDPLRLATLATLVERTSGIHQSPLKPVTGMNIFRHESGVHVDGMLKDQRSYEFLPAAWLGRRHEFVLGKHSGAGLVRHLLHESGVRADEARVQELLHEVKTQVVGRPKTAFDRAFDAKQDFAQQALAGVASQVLLAWAKEGR